MPPTRKLSRKVGGFGPAVLSFLDNSFSVSVFQCVRVSVFQCFSVSVYQCFSVSVFRGCSVSGFSFSVYQVFSDVVF